MIVALHRAARAELDGSGNVVDSPFRFATTRGRNLMDVLSIGTALAAFKTAVDLARTAVEVRDEKKLALALQEIQDKLLSVTIAATDVAEKNAALVQELATTRQEKLELHERLTKLERRQSEEAEYELTELAPGHWVYVHAPSVKEGKRPHYLCSTCFKQGKQAILKEQARFGVVELGCPLCKNEYDTGRRVPFGM